MIKKKYIVGRAKQLKMASLRYQVKKLAQKLTAEQLTQTNLSSANPTLSSDVLGDIAYAFSQGKNVRQLERNLAILKTQRKRVVKETKKELGTTGKTGEVAKMITAKKLAFSKAFGKKIAKTPFLKTEGGRGYQKHVRNVLSRKGKIWVRDTFRSASWELLNREQKIRYAQRDYTIRGRDPKREWFESDKAYSEAVGEISDWETEY